MARRTDKTNDVVIEKTYSADDMTRYRAWSRSGVGDYVVQLDTEFHTSTCTCDGGLFGQMCAHQLAAIADAYYYRAVDQVSRLNDRTLEIESRRYVRAVVVARDQMVAMRGSRDRRARKLQSGIAARAAAWSAACGDEIARRMAAVAA